MAALHDIFEAFFAQEFPHGRESKIALAVSGGLDSVVMTHLFYRAGYNCEIAHCNFQLRGEDADADEDFARNLSKHYEFPFHSKRFNTSLFARDNSLSVQMAARKLRYEWFEQLINKYHFSAVALGHHADDVAETMLLNLVKGTGLAGMHGIRSKNGPYIRPVLAATKQDLEAYASEHGLSWRVDASNNEVYYQRNRIRHTVIPLLKEINPGVTAALLHHAKLMSGYEAIIENYISEISSQAIQQSGNGITTIVLKPLLSSPAPVIVLYHLLKPYGASGEMCDALISSSGPGAEFHTKDYKIVRERESLTIFNNDFSSDKEFYFNHNYQSLDLPSGVLSKEHVDVTSTYFPETLPRFSDRNTAYIDESELKFPLLVRKWRAGDSFQPLGMKGRKLLSDFLIDQKFSSGMKEVVYLLISEKAVVWVIGHRIDDRFKLKEKTKKAIRFSFIPN